MSAQTATEEVVKKAPYTALVYFHGMGEQRRYEEVSRLVDSLELFDRDSTVPRMNSIRFEVEPPRTNLPREVGYFRVMGENTQENNEGRHVRFYEAYYANLAAGGVSAINVLIWLFTLIIRPWSILRARWREVPKLRKATLLGIWDRIRSHREITPEEAEKFRKIIQTYDNFHSLPQTPEYPKGSIREYYRFVESDNSINRNDLDQIGTISRSWFRRFIRVQATILFLIFTFLLALFLVGYFLVGLVTQPPLWIPTPLFWAIFAIVLLAIGLFLRAFLRTYLGDVYFWTTYEETADKHRKRREIRDYCASLLSHVLEDEACDRVFLVGHSLGTTVSYETILELGIRARLSQDPEAWTRLKKIKCLITLASPVDKIHYLFETRTSKSYHYNSALNELRGDREPTPFFDGDQALIRWINFWDRADVVSSPLYTPNIRREVGLDVENREVTSNIFPFPTYAHSNYVQNRYVLHRIHSLVFETNMDEQSEGEQTWEADVRRLAFTTALFHGALIAMPWLGFLLMLCNWWNLPAPGLVLTYALGVNIFFLLAGLALSLRERPRHTLVEPKLTETRLKMA